jgi:hypothetical protein
MTGYDYEEHMIERDTIWKMIRRFSKYKYVKVGAWGTGVIIKLGCNS